MPRSLKIWYLDTKGRKMQKAQGQVRIQSCIVNKKLQHASAYINAAVHGSMEQHT